MLKIIICFAMLAGIQVSSAASVKWQTTVFKQGGYAIGKVETGTTVKFLNHEVSTTPEGRFMIGFGRDMASKVTLFLHDKNGSTQIPLSIAKRQYKIERIDGLPPGKVNPRSKSELTRIKDDTRQIVSARAKRLSREDFLNRFIWPMTGRISGVYGSQRVLNGEPRRPHYGVDIAAKTGTKVFSPNAGTVTLVHKDMFFSGGTLIIDHGYGLSSTFIHLNDIYVQPGQKVNSGDLIAAVGATGRATGPHLDWRINWLNQRLDPQLFVGEMVVDAKKKPEQLQ